MTLDPQTRDLFAAISEALQDTAAWPAIRVRSAIDRVLDGTDDPGAAADWLREFLAQHKEATHDART